MPDLRLRLVVVGSPEWLGPRAAESLRRRGASIEAVLGRDEQSAQALADLLRAKWAYCQWEKMRRESQIDGVILDAACGADDVREALRSKWSVLLDEEFHDPGSFGRLARSVSKKTLPFVMQGLRRRFAPAVVRLRELLADGTLGDPLAASCVMRIGRHPTPDEVPVPRGVLSAVDLTTQFVGPASTVTAIATPAGVVSATLRCESGAVASVHVEPAPSAEDVGSRLTILGTRGHAVLVDEWELDCRGDSAPPVVLRPGFAGGVSPDTASGYRGMLWEFATALLERRRPLGHLGSMGRVAAATKAVGKSIQTGGRPVRAEARPGV